MEKHISIHIKGCGTHAEILASLKALVADFENKPNVDAQLDARGELEWESESLVLEADHEHKGFNCDYCGGKVNEDGTATIDE